jgi:hypothetical protein
MKSGEVVIPLIYVMKSTNNGIMSMIQQPNCDIFNMGKFHSMTHSQLSNLFKAGMNGKPNWYKDYSIFCIGTGTNT